MDALGMMRREDDLDVMGITYERYAIEPSVLYPAALDDLLHTEQISEADIEIARQRQIEPSLIARRKELLVKAAHHFRRIAVAQHGPGLGFHILNDPTWSW
jgi:hypothetical protein